MENHVITVAELIDWRNTDRLMYARSTAQHKALFANLTGGFEVEYKNKVIFQYVDPVAAVEKYNSILE